MHPVNVYAIQTFSMPSRPVWSTQLTSYIFKVTMHGYAKNTTCIQDVQVIWYYSTVCDTKSQWHPFHRTIILNWNSINFSIGSATHGGMAINMTYMYEKVSTLSVLDYMPYALVIQFAQMVRQHSLYIWWKEQKNMTSNCGNLTFETYRHTQETQMCTHKISVLLHRFIALLYALFMASFLETMS